MSFYVGVSFERDKHSNVFKVLEKFDFPIATFASSCEEFACMKDIGCSACGHLVTDVHDNNRQNVFCFIEADKQCCKELWSEIIDVDGVQTAFFADSIVDMFQKYIRILCVECKNSLHSSALSSNGSPSNLPEDFDVKKDNSLVHPYIYQQYTAPETSYEGAINPEYQWTKCKLCMRILRTTRSDVSRMKTLQTSHARNHVTRFQYACKLCTYGCRFHGGIQLHMTRMHPKHRNAYIDRSKDLQYRDEIAAMVITCFGQQVQSSFGSKAEMSRAY